ncbi:MAG: hypothetical protein VX589_18820 [Myxococcota bacterium]|nr:hypothetical protein [Myxococcota bacterium]
MSIRTWTAALIFTVALSSCHGHRDSASSTSDPMRSDDEVNHPKENENEASDGRSERRALNARDTFVIKRLYFSRENSGKSVGFDLDDRESDSADDQGCYASDFEDPTFGPGVDNQFALLLPLIEAAGGEAVEPYAQTAVNQGRMLLFFEILNSAAGTAHDVTVRLYRALGDTIVGTDGFLLPWQTFDIDIESAWFDAKGQRRDGILTVENFEFTLPIYIFDFYFEARLLGGKLRIEWGEHGRHTGVIAGAVTLNNILEIADAVEGGSEEAALIHSLGSSYADLLPDENGACQALSVTLQFETTGAFLYEDSPRFPDAP